MEQVRALRSFAPDPLSECGAQRTKTTCGRTPDLFDTLVTNGGRQYSQSLLCFILEFLILEYGECSNTNRSLPTQTGWAERPG